MPRTNAPDADADEPGMIRREIILPDGRLMTFYTFADADGPDE
jgi:hypothetical protein